MNGPIVLDVIGKPEPQGSKDAKYNPKTGRVVLRESAKGLKDWREAIAWEARAWAVKHPGPPIAVPCQVDASFYFVRPTSLAKKASAWKGTKPDVDKLTRAVLDALVMGGVLARDQLVAKVAATKVLVTDRPAGARITLQPLEPEAA